MAKVLAMVLPALVIVMAFVLGLFVDHRHKLAVMPLPPWTQIVIMAMFVGLEGGFLAYFDDGVRSVPELIETAVLWALIVPVIHLGNLVRDKVSPRQPR
jgi:hypothetical protein